MCACVHECMFVVILDPKIKYITHLHANAVLEIMVSIQTLSDHFGVLSDPKMFGSDIWLSTTSCSFHTHRDVIKSFVLRMSTYAFIIC